MITRKGIRFYLNDELVELVDVQPQQTVLDYLRLECRLRGTKEGCAEGDCGACTVLVGRLDARGELRYETVNACIRFLASLDGTHLVTVEQLAGPEQPLHPVQQAMVDHHASQCGFCTPGFVMSLYGLWLQRPMSEVADIEQALQGNLCRCTGYASIIRAAQAVHEYGAAGEDPLLCEAEAMREKLRALHDGACVVMETSKGRAILPASTDDLVEVLESEPRATLVSGSTDVGLWATKFLRDIPVMVFLNRIQDLHRLEVEKDRIVLGAGVSYTETEPAILAHFPQLKELWNRIGGRQVRNMGTIGGNIANGSPIGDTPPALIALGASVGLRGPRGRRLLPLEDFFIDYGKQDRASDEFVEYIDIPRLGAGDRYAVYKISKRFDEDISAVLGAFRVSVADGVIVDARIAYGGMAATPRRALAVEGRLVGRPFTRGTVEDAMQAYEEDFKPLSDWRASAEYRLTVARNLLLRFWAETEGQAPVRVRELVHE